MDSVMMNNMKSMNSITAEVCAHQAIDRAVNYPERIALTYSYQCNYRCIMCNLHGMKTKRLPVSLLEKIYPVFPFAKSLCISGGEPLVDRHWADWFKESKKFGLVNEVNTNGSLLQGENSDIMVDVVDKINISIDGATESTYRFIRQADLKQVLRGVEELSGKAAGRNKRLDMSFRFVAMENNIKELSKVVAIAARMGVGLVTAVYLRVNSLKMLNESLFFHQDLSDYNMQKAKEVASQLGVKLSIPQLFGKQDRESPEKSSRKFCSDPWKYFEISPTGAVGLCCSFAGGGDNIIASEFDEVWNSKLKMAIRRTVNSNTPRGACKDCMVGSILDPNRIESHVARSVMTEAGLDTKG